MELHPTLLQLALELLGGLRVRARDDLIHDLEDMDLRPKVDEEGGELAPDHSSTDDGDTIRALWPIEGMVGADDLLAIEVIAGDRA